MIDKLKNNSFFIFLPLFFIFILARDNNILNIPLYFYTVLYACFALFFRKEEVIGFTICASLYSQALQINYIFVISAVVLILKHHKSMKLSYPIGMLCILALWELLHFYIPPFSMGSYLRFCSMLFFFAAALSLKADNIKKIIDIYLVNAVFAMFDILMQYLMYHGYSLMNVLTSKYRFGNVYLLNNEVTQRVFDNEVNIALFCLLGIVLSFILFRYYKQKRYLVVFALLTVFGFMTRSKTFLICIALCFIVFCVYFYSDLRKMDKRKRKKIYIGLLVFGLASLPFVYMLLKNVLMRFLTASSLTSGRTELFLAYNEYWMSSIQNIVFGIGLQEPIIKTGAENSMHNMIQEIYVCWGAIGLLMMAAFFYTLYQKIKKENAWNKLSLFLCAVFFIYLNSMQYIRLPYIFILTLLVYYSFYLKEERNMQREGTMNSVRRLLMKAMPQEQYQKYLRRSGLKFGKGCDFYKNVTFGTEPWLIKMGNHVRLTHNVSFITHDGSLWVVREMLDDHGLDLLKPIILGDNVFVGWNSTIMPGVKIGNNVIIGCNSTVTKDIPDNQVWAGAPARFLMSVDEYILKHKNEFQNTHLMKAEEKRAYYEKKYREELK